MHIHKFTKANLAEVCESDWTSKEELFDKRQFIYLFQYLRRQGCKSILVEDDYISKDFLDNYQFYYASCYMNYPKKCKRLHFFKSNLSDSKLRSLVISGKSENHYFDKYYLGFSVIRPIPSKIFGFSLLKTYFGLSVQKSFWGTRPYSINLFGLSYTFNSLAFQEQDGTLSACATTAIWGALSKSNYLNYTMLKTPNQITKDAGITSNSGGRLFPNKGLTINQVCNSLVRAGLETEVLTAKKERAKEFLKTKDSTESIVVADAKKLFEADQSKYLHINSIRRVVNAYARLGIPIICIFQPYEDENLHAITINGYKKKQLRNIIVDPKLYYHYELIETFYAHDDQWGPFTKLEVTDNKAFGIETIWTEKLKPDQSSRVISLVVPIYKKVRVDYLNIESIIIVFKSIFNIMSQVSGHKSTFDYFVINSNYYKKEIRANKSVSKREKLKFILKSLPKYVWIIRIYHDLDIHFDLVLDATDVSTNMLGLMKINYGSDVHSLNTKYNANFLKYKDQIRNIINTSRLNNKYLYNLIISNMYYNYEALTQVILSQLSDKEELKSYKKNSDIANIFLERNELSKTVKDQDLISHLESFGLIEDIYSYVKWVPILWASFCSCRHIFESFKGKPSSKWTSGEINSFAHYLENELLENNIENADEIVKKVSDKFSQIL